VFVSAKDAELRAASAAAEADAGEKCDVTSSLPPAIATDNVDVPKTNSTSHFSVLQFRIIFFHHISQSM